MITEVLISYPWWTIIFVIVAGLVYAGLLYVKNPLNKLSGTISVILFVFRFLSVSVLTFLLLSPTIITKRKQIERPIVIIAQDNSRSILMNKDSSYYVDNLSNSVDELTKALSKNSDVDSYLFGTIVKEGSSPDYSDNTSNYSNIFTHIKQNYSGLNIGAIVLVGDGIYNNGIDPIHASSDIRYPVFTVALGDTSSMLDSKIDDIRYNSIVYSGDIFEIEVTLSASLMKGHSTTVKLLEGNKEIAEETVAFSSNSYRKTIKFNVEATIAGKHRYKIIVEPGIDEISVENNIRNIFIDVLDSRHQILILAYAPHPDIGAIKQSLLKNINYQVDVDYIGGFSGDVTDYDLVILHQLPAKKNSARNVLNKLAENKIPQLFVLSSESNLVRFNKYFKGLNILSTVGSKVNARFDYNDLFTYFSFNNEYASELSSLPPLSVPLGNYELSLGTEIFGWQIVNGILTDYPLVVYYNDLGIKSGVISGEGLWLWRIHNQLQYGNSDAVDAFINKSAMYLIADTDKRHFKIQSKGVYDSNEDVVIVAELYNKALQPINSSDVKLTLANEVGDQFNFVFSPFDDYYKLNLNKLPVGIYSYKANVKLGSDVYDYNGEFIVQQLDNESRFLNANHRLLNQMATEHDGIMYYPNEIDSLLVDINNLNSMTSRVYYDYKFSGLNSLIYVMIGVLLLLSIEWFMRKYFGNY